MAAAASSSAAASASSSGSGRRNPAATAAGSADAACACPICLEAFKDEAYLDTCLHSFCYKCICQWVKIVASKHEEPLSSVRCPLCKTVNVSIIHAFDGETFQRHYITQDLAKRSVLISLHLLDAHELISQFYNTKDISDNMSSVQQYWKQRKYLRKNMWLETWLRREIQALTQDENVEAIVHHIHGVIESFMKRQEKPHASKKISLENTREEFKSLLSDAARPFLLGRTSRFVAEVELFLVSQMNIDAYSRVRVKRFKESASHLRREQDALPQDQPLEDHYLYFLSDQIDCVGGNGRTQGLPKYLRTRKTSIQRLDSN
ncbi:hypothetical protein BRADI_1g04550v3 [Brachypodium distachyon]|uniref:RING-type domain-containing protein n=1 Tax=Brachypodium distachyon TaxID=15368 RepID=A0A2K2DI36_BRADI|nr:hypothetical protein BRADI_1g04550v3 [Brachypodium distachyon]